MATVYVRKSGSDSNTYTQARSASTAWLTIGHALSTMSSGDTCYIGSGVYRETVSVSITPAATTTVIGDVDGSNTGDAPGEIRWTAWTTNDKTAPSSGTATLDLNGKSYLTFQNLTLVGGHADTVKATTSNSTNITFQDCTIFGGVASNTYIVNYAAGAALAANWSVNRCRCFGFWGGTAAIFNLQSQ